jgi:Tfp pilus assembly protein PilO
MRLKFVVIGLGCAAVAAAWFLFVFRPNQAKLSELRDDVSTTKQEVAALETQLRQLQQLQRDEPKLRANVARFGDALPTDPRIPDFILQVQEAANNAGIDFLSITPSLPTASVTQSGGATPSAPAASAPPSASAAPAAGATAAAPTTTTPSLKEISISLTANGTFFELEDFIYRLEHLHRALRIDTFGLDSGGGGEGDQAAQSPKDVLSVSLKIRVFTAPAPVTTTPAASTPASSPEAA